MCDVFVSSGCVAPFMYIHVCDVFVRLGCVDLFMYMDYSSVFADAYQYTMAYSLWCSGNFDDSSVFEVYYREEPFEGFPTIAGGFEDLSNFLLNFCWSDPQVVCKVLEGSPRADEFVHWLYSRPLNVKCVSSVADGQVVQPGLPLAVLKGELLHLILIESAVLNMLSFPTLITSLSAAFRSVVGPEKKLYEFGLRRAQGPNGAMSASRFACLGGFDGTSNIVAASRYGLPLVGSMGHAFITQFMHRQHINGGLLDRAVVHHIRTQVCDFLNAQPAPFELEAFCVFAETFSKKFIALIDTVNVLESGLVNFVIVAIAMHRLNYLSTGATIGVRIDSGDLSTLATRCRECLCLCAHKFDVPVLGQAGILVSNDLSLANVEVLCKNPAITGFGIGTRLVTCDQKPALGLVYKLVANSQGPCFKLNSDCVAKRGIPFEKRSYRWKFPDGRFVDVLALVEEDAPPCEGYQIMGEDAKFVSHDECQSFCQPKTGILLLSRALFEKSMQAFAQIVV